ncbi:MAG: peptide deformylase, partial [Acinetobacter johnsonii]
ADAEFNSDWLMQLASAMIATMLERSGVGIAAPQVYISKRVIIVASRPNLRYHDAPEMDAVVMVNPEILEFSQATTLGEEGCLSVPNELGQVQRAQSIKVLYHTLTGEVMESTFEGFPARIVQHEIDHLNGILFVDRLSA